MEQDASGFQSYFDLDMNDWVRAARDVLLYVDFFEQLDKGLSVEQIAIQNNFDLEALNRICGVLEATGILDKIENNDYKTSMPFREFAIQRGQFFMGKPDESKEDEPIFYKILSALNDVSSDYNNLWLDKQLDDSFVEMFLKNMNRHSLPPLTAEVRSGLFDQAKTIIDAGGGGGALALAWAKERGSVSQPEMIIFDLPQICQFSELLTKSETGSFLRYFPGHFFDQQWALKGDLFHFSNIFHDWSAEKVLHILRNTYECLEPGGRIVVHETLLDHKPVHQVSVRAFHLLIYCNSRGGKYTFKKLKELLEVAGFRNVHIAHEFQMYSSLVGTK